MTLITFVTRVHFADRVLEDALAEELARLGVRRPLVLIEDHLAGGEEAERLGDALPLDAAPVHFEVRAWGPADAGLREAAALFAEAGCDGIVGCGGARTLDLARLLGGSGAPVIAVPTGTESVGLGPFAVDFARHAARQAFIPSAILCDATLTTAAGPAATAAAGMDALVHCLEAYLSTAYNPPADGIALDGLRRAALNLEAAVENGRDLHARRELLAAALNAGLAAQKGLGGIEAAARGLEAEAGTSNGTLHGALHGAILPEVLAFNAPAVSDRFAAIGAVLGPETAADVAGRLSRLAERVGLPVRLSAAGFGASVLPRAARGAAADPANRTNPRLATHRDYQKIMAAAL
jgi:4-hydroxybutyrate dehydrogenase